MYKKRILILLVLVILAVNLPVKYIQAEASVIDSSNLNKGIITINYKPENNITTKVMIQKDKKSYTYTLSDNNVFPLQLGDGQYTISILEQVKENKYRQVEKETVQLKLSEENAVYLQSIQLIYWDSDMDAVKKAAKLTKNVKSDEDKIAAIYDYIVSNIRYDKVKASKVKSDYIPSIDDIFEDSKGICYDYSALFAAMLRSVGIPTKLVMGYKNDISEYHAWNQVYLEAEDKWVTIDTTYDAAFYDGKSSNDWIKDSGEYSIKKLY
ncbi:MAG: transglutaminase-like enzyme putative cysteine protease [Lachnospiraceae bacterium]|jgi:transglutaminase-like putative cysteine protease|nr:transglutaminase-like enzyme putative cysteine protease [Lachnospiraceae bacterium]